MGKLFDYTVEVTKKLERINKVQARDYYEVNKKLGIIIRRGRGVPGRPRRGE